ncbi:hypothetical protein OSB04_un000101 [Centaurea solstitialis]|uniref:Reverse transcriptase domain-containing protein n=1 Tax=Centaurea solstitialis TaxID=347529 RepID=A0AA38SIQ3_9ASTR|nr:hypothetical protein OSB04_un000101 [Centaurea solstitialis]
MAALDDVRVVDSVDDSDDDDSDLGDESNNGLAKAAAMGVSPRVPSRVSIPKSSAARVLNSFSAAPRVSSIASDARVTDASTVLSSNTSTTSARVSGVSTASNASMVMVSDAPAVLFSDATTVSAARVSSSVESKGVSAVGPVGPNSYASVLNVAKNSKGNSLSFFPLEDKSSSKIEIPLELLKKSSAKYECTLYGYFLGPRLYFPTVEKDVKRLWGKFGFQEAMMNNHGFLFFRFSSADGMRQVMEEGPWMIRGVPLFVFPWDPLQGLVKPEHKTCPLWVKLHNVPLVAFNREGVARIASALGEPKLMDDHTAAMCDNAWGRPGFAKVLIDVWAVGELKRELAVVVPNLYGGKGVEVKIEVEYLWEPSQCSHCKVFGHKVAACAKAEIEKIKAKGKAKQVVDNEGFTVVANKKHKGIKIQEPKSIPLKKPTQVYVPIKKGDVGSSGTKNSSAVESLPNQPSTLHKSSSSLKETPPGVATPKVPVSVCTTDTQASNKEPFSNLKLFMARRGKPISTSNAFSSLDTDEGVGVTNTVEEFLDDRTDDLSVLGLNSSVKQREVKFFISSSSLSLCVLLETHLYASKLVDCAKSVFGSWEWNSNQIHSQRGVRILVGWNPVVLDATVIGMSDQVLHCQLRIKHSGTSFLASFVYGSNKLIVRRHLWEDLRLFSSLAAMQPWIVMGDFNAILSPDESVGSPIRRDARMEEFVECVESLNVFDLRCMGSFFTWAQKPLSEGGIYRKLDRVMNSVALFLSRGISDHSSCIITLDTCQSKARCPFKFDNFLALRSEFLDVVKCAWDFSMEGTYMYILLQKLRNLKQPLRVLRSSTGNVSARVKEKRSIVDHAQSRVDLNPRDLVQQDNLSFAVRHLQEALKVEDSYFRQRAKVRWIKEGDLNTSFFHNAVKERKNRSFIHSVTNSNGEEVHGAAVGKAFVEHFRSILGARDMEVKPDIPPDFFVNRLSIEDANFMTRPITKAEVKLAMWDIGDDRAPGSDGYTASFFKAAWSVVGKDVEMAVQDFFYRGRLARQVNHTAICLLPKHANASKVTDFRPISLCTVLYKCIAKIISWRIKESLDFLVSPNQSAFIPGRRISDNIMMAYELVQGYDRQNGPPRCSFKIDIQKAYDSVDWCFLCTILDRMGFHPIMRHWIMELVATTSFSIMVNGDSHGFFKGERGIRQGCPLSPYLFTLVMEAFSAIFMHKVMTDQRFAFHRGCEGLSLTHLCFADDLMVFARGDVGSVVVLKEVLAEFGSISGLKPSLAKSAVYFSNVDPDTQHSILQVLSFQVGTLPFRYLGVPLSSKKLVVADFAILVDKVRSRILNWKSKFLSFGGRLQLIKSVLESLQLYWMAIVTFPTSITHTIEKLFRDFLWAHGNSSRGKVKVSWEVVCKPKLAGGLGLKRLPMWNRALLVSHIWDILRKKKSVWVTWIHLHRLSGSTFWTVQPTNNSSWIWRKLLDLREQVRPFFFSSLGNGLSTNAWEDKWLSVGSLSSLIPFRLMHGEGFTKSSTVSEVLTTIQHSWPQPWLLRFPALSEVTVPALNQNTRDQVMWLNMFQIPRPFSIKEVWRSFLGNLEVVPWFDVCWFKHHIPKHSFCLWLAILNRLPTQDRLLQWGIGSDRMSCLLCNGDMDSRDHLFFRCSYSSSFWKLVRNEIGCMTNDAWDDVLHDLTHRRWHPGEVRKQLFFAGSIYYIWRERNNRLFNGLKRGSALLFSDLKLHIDTRCRSTSTNVEDLINRGESSGIAGLT